MYLIEFSQRHLRLLSIRFLQDYSYQQLLSQKQKLFTLLNDLP